MQTIWLQNERIMRIIDLNQGSGRLQKVVGFPRTTYQYLPYICSQKEGVKASRQKRKPEKA